MRGLPLNIGLPLLLAVLLAAGLLDFGPWRSILLGGAIVLALWMAFSLRIPPRDEADMEDPDVPALDDPDPDAPEPLRPLTEEEQQELEREAERYKPLRRP